MTVRYAFLLLAITFLAGCSSTPAPRDAQAAEAAWPAGAALEVQTARAESRRIERAISVTGSLQPEETAIVSNEIAGLLAEIRADFGQPVRRGEVIAELDKEEFQLQLDRAKAALAQALARIGLGPDEADRVPETTPAIRQAEALAEDARTRYESAAELVKTGDIAADRFVEIDKAYRARLAALDAARHELNVALAAIRSLKAEVSLAEKRLRDATIRAPFDGAVAERMAAPGEYLRQNAPIVRLVKTHPLRLRVEIPETAAGAVRVGTTLTFTTDAISGERFRAAVREINPSLDSRSRSLLAEARLVDSDPRLRPGMFVQVRLVAEPEAEIVVVPEAAIRSVAGLTKVFSIHDGKAREHRVSRGEVFDGWVELRHPAVAAGDVLAVSALDRLVDGAAVKPQETEG